MKLLIVGLTCFALLSGCMATQQALDDGLALLADNQTAMRSDIDRTRSQLTISNGFTQERIDAGNAKLDSMVNALDATDAGITAVRAKIQPLIDAEDPAAVVQGIGQIIAPYLGPLGVPALLITNVLSGLLTRRRTQTTTANHLIAPMEASRNRAIEARLNSGTDPGNFIVFNKDTLGPAHAANGAGALIARVTG